MLLRAKPEGGSLDDPMGMAPKTPKEETLKEMDAP